MPEAAIGVTRSPEAAASDAYINNVRSVEAAFKRFHAVSVEELTHDPSDLLGFFVDEDPADDCGDGKRRKGKKRRSKHRAAASSSTVFFRIYKISRAP